MAKEMIQDERIKEILKWGPMSALYFTIAVDVLDLLLGPKNAVSDNRSEAFQDGEPNGKMISAIENIEAIEAIKALLTQVAS